MKKMKSGSKFIYRPMCLSAGLLLFCMASLYR